MPRDYGDPYQMKTNTEIRYVLSFLMLAVIVAFTSCSQEENRVSGSDSKVETPITVKSTKQGAQPYGIINKTTGKKYETVKEAVNDAKANEIIELAAGEYPLTVDPALAVQNKDFFLKIGNNQYSDVKPTIDQKGLTIRGNGRVVLYGNTQQAKGALTTQNLVTVLSDNVTFENIIFMDKHHANKTIEVQSTGFRMKNCSIALPTIRPTGDTSQSGGLYLGSNNRSFTATIEDCIFEKASVTVKQHTNVTIKNCVFNGIRPMNGCHTCLEVRGEADVENCIFNIESGKEAVKGQGAGVVRIKSCQFPTTRGVYWNAYDNSQIMGEGIVGDILNEQKKTIYASIKDAIYYASDSTNNILLSGKVFNESLYITTNKSISITGTDGTKIKAVHLNHTGNLTFENIEFYGTPADTGKPGVVFITKGNTTLRKCYFHFNGTTDTGRIPLKNESNFNQHIIVDGCTFNSPSGGCVYFNPPTANGSITVTNCTFTSKGTSNDIEIVDGQVLGATYSNNSFGGTKIGITHHCITTPTSIDNISNEYLKKYCNDIIGNNTFAGKNQINFYASAGY